jgi:hypothetical protein
MLHPKTISIPEAKPSPFDKTSRYKEFSGREEELKEMYGIWIKI